MRTRVISEDNLINSRINIGFVGENLATEIRINCKKAFAEYPQAVPALSVKPPKGNEYPAVATRDGDFVVWDILNSDLIYDGDGEVQISFIQDAVVKKTYSARTTINPSVKPTGSAPTPIENWLVAANTALNGIPAAIDAALQEAKDSGEFDGKDGAPGKDGADGKDGTDGAPGRDGADGHPGQDGFSPIVTVEDITGGHRVSITDATGTKTFDVMDGETPSVPVTDVQVSGTSIVEDGVADIPLASQNNFGVGKVATSYGTAAVNGVLQVQQADNSQVKSATGNYRPITPSQQHMATFYGLAKASGDSTQSSSANAVGTYTEDAKSAISQMLNAPVSVSGSTPTINAKPGVRYICGECATLSITLPASGCIDVTFTSGSTATVLTITPPTGVTVKWANGFDPSSLDANTTYEINIMDGLGVACAWT